MKKFRTWIKSPLGITLAGAAFGVLLTLLADFIKQIPVFETIAAVFQFLGRWIVKILLFDIKVWWLLIALSVLILVLYLIAKYTKPNLPDFYPYTDAKFFGYHWTWKWKNNYDGTWSVILLTAHCPTCDTNLMRSEDHYADHFMYECPRCNFIRSNVDINIYLKVEMLINDNVKKQTFSVN